MRFDFQIGAYNRRLQELQTGLCSGTGSAALNVHVAMLLCLVGRQSEVQLQLSSVDMDTSVVSVRFVQASALSTALCTAIVCYTHREYVPHHCCYLRCTLQSEIDDYDRYEAGATALQKLATDATSFWHASTGVDGLIPDAWRPLGLSNAQRDLCTQLYLRLLINWGTRESLEEARKLVEIRLCSGKDAALTGRLQAMLARASL